MIRLDFLNVGMVEETGGVLLVLRAPELARLLVIETGLLEGQAIALEKQGVRSDRPLTQDLLHHTVRALGARVKEVQIREFTDEAFLATIVLMKPNGGEGTLVELDARPSDAIGLALRAEAPILVEEKLLAEMGIPEEAEGRFEVLFDDEEDDDEDADEEGEEGKGGQPRGRVVH